MSWFPRRTIVVPVDFSDESFQAVDTALELAGSPDGVHVIHVLPEPSLMEPDMEWQEIDLENRRTRAKDLLRRRFVDDKYKAMHLEVDFGDAGYRIAGFAQDVEADLIITPSHGRTGIKRILLGSVAERVIRLSHCPVLVLRK